jgi:hypothetical protein
MRSEEAAGIALSDDADHTISVMAQDVIRAWAREHNISVGARGRLPQAALTAYFNTTDHAPQESISSMLQPAVASAATINNYEPLADYLEPRFGSIYDWDNSSIRWGVEGGFDVQRWTVELKAAVTHYFLHEVSDADYAALLQETGSRPSDDRAAEVGWIVDHNQPWEVADACHKAAIDKAPTLGAVLNPRLSELGAEDLIWDAALWLDANARYDQLLEIARYRYLAGGFPEDDTYSSYQDPRFGARERLIDVLVDKLSPDELAHDWDHVGDAASLDPV